MTPENVQLVGAWFTADKVLEHAKIQELAAREKVQQAIFPSEKKGTRYENIDNTHRLKGEFKQYYTAKSLIGSKTYDDLLEAMEKLSPTAQTLLLRWKPDVSITAYKALTEEEHKIIDPFITITDGKPSFEVVPIK
jgi:uncharacterized protein (DUF2252 family)